MDARRIGLGLGALALLAWLWPWGGPAPAADPQPPVQRERVRIAGPRRVGAPELQHGGPSAAEPVAEPVVDDRLASVERAFERFAEASGDGLIRCAIGPGVREGDVYGLPGFAQREGDVVIAAVPVAAGEVALTRERLLPTENMSFEDYQRLIADADDPARDFAVARWEGAHAGSWGICVVERLSPTEIDARLGRDPDAESEPARLDADDLFRRADAFAAAVAIARESDDTPAVQDQLQAWEARAAERIAHARRMTELAEIAAESVAVPVEADDGGVPPGGPTDGADP